MRASGRCGALLGQLRGSEHGKPFFNLHVFGVCLQWTAVVFLIFTSLSLLFFFFFSPVTVLVFFFFRSSFTPFSAYHFFFLLWLHSIFFFLILSFGSLFSLCFWVKSIACVSFLSSLPFFLFLSPALFPFHSIGTREVVTQKNLSGLVPIRDLRLDPSLLCSIPLLALSPNLLIVWLFLSIAYLVTKFRCK